MDDNNYNIIKPVEGLDRIIGLGNGNQRKRKQKKDEENNKKEEQTTPLFEQDECLSDDFGQENTKPNSLDVEA